LEKEYLRLGKYIRMGESELNKSEKWFENHGTIAVFAGMMAPGIRELFLFQQVLVK
jgi:membrane protein DedA with SNARE-associated domain